LIFILDRLKNVSKDLNFAMSLNDNIIIYDRLYLSEKNG